MCPLPAGSRGYSSCLETGCSAAHTQTFVTISRTCFLRLLSRGSQTLYAGEKLQPTPPAATRHPGLRWLHRGPQVEEWEGWRWAGGACKGRAALTAAQARLGKSCY